MRGASVKSSSTFCPTRGTLNFQELVVAQTSSEATRDEEIEILSEGVVFAKKRYANAAQSCRDLGWRSLEVGVIAVDTPPPFRLSDVIAYVGEQIGPAGAAPAPRCPIAA